MQNLLKPLLAVKTKSGYSVFAIVVVTLFSSWVIFDATKSEVVIAADGQEQTIKTHSTTVGDLLDDVGIQVGKHDALSHGANTQIEDGMKIKFITARDVIITIDGEEEQYKTAAETVGELFYEENLTFSVHDEISHTAMKRIEEGLEIDIVKAYEIEINDGGEAFDVWTTGATVEGLLEENEITYNEIDKVKPALEERVEKGTKVSVIRVENKTVDIEESIPFHVKEKSDSSIKKGVKRTISEGEKGKVIKTYEITLENGKEVDREVIEEDIKKESKDKVVAVGTKQVQNKVVASTPVGSKPAGGTEFTMEATAYTPYCNGCSGISAAGINLRSNPNQKVVAVDPRVIPLGSTVWVEGYGTAIAGDTGGAIKGNRIDILKPNKNAAYSFGRRTVKVKVLN